MNGMRKLLIDGQVFWYRVGHQFTRIRLPASKKGLTVVVANHVLAGVSPNVFERGQHKRTSDGMVLPSQVAAYVRQQRPVDGHNVTRCA